MAIRGSCLCGAFVFEVERVAGPFEICHCNRCRKRSGAAGLPMVGVNASDYRVLSGSEAVVTYAAPVLGKPPPYHSHFCQQCGSPLPTPDPGEWFEIPAGLFDDDPQIRPDKHIFVELVPAWDNISDGLPQLTLRELVRSRRGEELPADHEMVTHHGDKVRV
ncbi:MAG: GFA family protein [Pseudomonadota bacterium]